MKQLFGTPPEPWRADEPAVSLEVERAAPAAEVTKNDSPGTDSTGIVIHQDVPAEGTGIVIHEGTGIVIHQGVAVEPTGIVIHQAVTTEDDAVPRPNVARPTPTPGRPGRRFFVTTPPMGIPIMPAPDPTSEHEAAAQSLDDAPDVLLAMADDDLVSRLETLLVGAGALVTRAPDQSDGPDGSAAPSIVIVDGVHDRLDEVIASWRAQPTVPAVVALGSPGEHDAAGGVIAPDAPVDSIVAALREASRRRFTHSITWSVMRAALGLPKTAFDPRAWKPTVQAARAIDVDVPRIALRAHVHHYVTPTPRLEELRERGIVAGDDADACVAFDGTRTVKTLVENPRRLDPQQTARLLWMLRSLDAIDFTPEVRDTETDARRALAELRTHVRARAARATQVTLYDVLEVLPHAPPEAVEDAYRALAAWCSPDVLAAHDLGDLAAAVPPMWQVAEQARAVLADRESRAIYNDRLRLTSRATTWAISRATSETAHAAHERGQQLLAAGDLPGAITALETACRHVPGHPDYEAGLAWARCRARVARGEDAVKAARDERQRVETVMAGCRPRPRALVALSLLCALSNDLELARWHLRKALALDPTVPAGTQLAKRLGLRT